MIRSRFLRYMAIATALPLLLAACTSGSKSNGSSGQDPAPGSKKESKLEVFSWWTSGGEAAALNALFDTYKKAVPGVEIVNAAVAGGAGTNAQAVLQTRLNGSNPPDTWQTHPGEVIDQYVSSGFVLPIDELYTSEGWDKAVPEGLLKIVKSKDGKYYQVLTGVHRANELWYNKKLLDQKGVQVPQDMTADDFVALLGKAKTAGIATPLCVGDQGIWASAQLFEITLIGVIGPDKYTGLFDGTVKFDDPDVKKAMKLYGDMLAFQNADHSALSWDQAVKKLVEGSCAFTAMGDWAHGEFVQAKWEDNKDVGWVTFPGTKGSYDAVMDSFVLPKGAPHADEAKKWLQSIGGKEAQTAFNALKGSTPWRSDVDKSKFGPYAQWASDSFGKDKFVPSMVHGQAGPAAFTQGLSDAVTGFVVDKNVDKLAQALVQSAKSAGMSK